MIRQCAFIWLFGFGELIVYLTGSSSPPALSVCCLTHPFLKLGWIKLQWVQGLSDFLVANLGFFFVPPE